MRLYEDSSNNRRIIIWSNDINFIGKYCENRPGHNLGKNIYRSQLHNLRIWILCYLVPEQNRAFEGVSLSWFSKFSEFTDFQSINWENNQLLAQNNNY